MAKKIVQVDVRGVPQMFEIEVPESAANIEVRFVLGIAPVFKVASMTTEQALNQRDAIEPIANALYDHFERLFPRTLPDKGEQK